MRQLPLSTSEPLFRRQYARSIATLFWVGLIFLPQGYAHGSAPNPDEGLAHYRQAKAMYEEQRYDDAKEAIERAYASDPLPVYQGFRAWCVFRLGDQAEGLRIMIALSESEALDSEEALDFQAAVLRMRDRAGTANLNLSADDPNIVVLLDGTALTKETVQGPIRVLPGSHTVIFQKDSEEKIHRVVVEESATVALVYEPNAQLKFAREFEGAIVHINGEILPLPIGLTMPLEAGSYQVLVQKNKQTIFAEAITLTPGEVRTLAPGKEAVVVASPRRIHRTQPRTYPAILAAVGLSLIGGGAYFFYEAKQNGEVLDDLKPAADNLVHSRSQRNAFTHYEDSQEQSRNAAFLFTLGGAALGGAALWAWWPAPSRPDSLSLGPGTLHFRASF